jgi:hypothetical protein
MLANRNHGIIVAPQDQESFTSGLRQALQTKWDRERIAAWGQSRCWEDVARDTVDALHALMPGRSASKQPDVADAQLQRLDR